jgi:tetratricopeptide (TPR) repeat protein
MTPEEALINIADQVLRTSISSPLTDIQRMILRESLADKKYESMEGYAPQHIKNEGKRLWDLLSKALNTKVSKTNFKGALEERLKSGDIVLKPPMLSIYNPQTWVGREAIIDEFLPKLQGQTRSLWITGISGIGKTTLAECIASQAWKSDPSFQWIYLEILEGQSSDFVSVAADLLAKLGDTNLDLQERNDPKRLTERLLRKLQANFYWIQLDSLERLLNPEQQTEFADDHWIMFLQRCLMEPNFASRLVLTAQALPSALAELGDRYPNVWQAITLQGLSADDGNNEHLELFTKNGITVDESNSSNLSRIGQIYEGHPLVLQVITKEILAVSFCGNVASYWQRYGNEFEQVARELQPERVNPALYNQALQRQVRRRVEASLKRLPTDALDLLCRSAVYRRPVPETFWLAMISDRTPQQQQEAYQVLGDRALIEREGVHQGYFLIRQHNLIRSVAYDRLKTNTDNWYQAERQAALLWLTAYEPAPNAPNLETLRGYLEAFDHYCEVGDWDIAKKILLDQKIGLQLQKLGSYQEVILYHQKLLDHVNLSDEATCKRLLGNSYYFIGRYVQSIEFYQKSLDAALACDDVDQQQKALNGFGNIYRVLGDYHQSIEYLQKALLLACEIGDREGEGQALGNLGIAWNYLGKCQEAINYHQQQLIIAIENSDLYEKGIALGNLGNAYYSLGDCHQAIDYHQQRLKITHEIGDRRGESNTLGSLGLAYHDLGEYSQAINYHEQYLTIARELGERRGEGNALRNLGITQARLKNHEEAIEKLCIALEIFSEIGDREGEADVLKNLAHLHQTLGTVKVALQYCHQALALATDLDIPLAEECRKLAEELEKSGATGER